MKLEALAFLLPLALYVSPLFYSYDQSAQQPQARPTMVTRGECEAALNDPSLVIRVETGPKREAAPEPVDLSICESLGEQYVAICDPTTHRV